MKSLMAILATVLLVVCAGAVLLSTTAATEPITTLHNTGGTPGLQASAWSLASTTSPVAPGWGLDNLTAYVNANDEITNRKLSWISNDPTSQWISPRPRYGGMFGGRHGAPFLATFTFSTEFEVPTGHDPSQSWFYFRMAADERVAAARLNGHDLSLQWDTHRSFSPYFLVNAGFVRGRNVLEVDVVNGVCTPGLRVEFGGSHMAPVP
jgi:hypothetical protein